jgi:ribulose-5-phosphate 4-epimerase/fuculose-1-phosphate aldolase
MSQRPWKVTEEILRLFRGVGRASLLYDIQDSHSGNMAVKVKDDQGREEIIITATGSQKGDLEPDQLCFLSPTETDYGYYKASSETDIHARILALPGIGASMHVHAKELAITTLDDAPKPARPPDFVPIDPLGWHYLGGHVPVDWFAVPSGSPEMTALVPERLAEHPATVVQGHGTFVRARTLEEAFFLACVANNAGQIVRQARKLDVDVERLRDAIKADPAAHFSFAPDAYTVQGDEVCDFPEETEILKEFQKAGARIFESRLSPFHTGSMSVRGVNDLLYAPKASMPREVGGPLLRTALRPEVGDPPELAMHKAIYAETDYQTVMHCWVPEAEAQAHFRYPGESEPAGRIVPIDAEGSFMYLVVPIVPPHAGTGSIIRLLHDYKVVVVRGGGVWAVGQQSISEVLHHPSSVREICLYRIGAFERGLDLRKMEPAKAGKW